MTKSQEVQRMAEEIFRLKVAMAWVGQVRPVNIGCSGARVEMTWDEFNAMRELIGLKRMKPTPRRAAA